MAETENLNNQPSHDEIRRNENDFSPGSIHGRSSSMSSPRGRPTRQLDFHQAMSDFKTMFPNMDTEIIEAVLRTNNGIVDATIDQLLTMSIDNETLEQTHVHWSPDLPTTHHQSHHHHHHHHHRHGHHSHREHGHSKSKSKRSSKQQAEVNGSRVPVNLESPPSYSEAIQAPSLHAEMTRSRSHSNTPRKSASKPQPTMLTTFRQAADSPSSSLLDLDVDDLALSNTEVKTPLNSTWSPNPAPYINTDTPLWGSPASMPDLPDHVSWHSLRPSKQSSSSPVKPPTYTAKTSPKMAANSGKSRGYRNWNPPLLGTLPDDFLRLSVATSPKCAAPSSSSNPLPKKSSLVKRSQSERHVRHHSQPARMFAAHEFSTDMLQKKMKENERKRRMTCHVPDPELAQYLADERLALMIQNTEFLQELRDNEDFMNTLESDRLNASAFEPPVSSPETAPTSDEDAKHVGYGEDHQTTLEAFPFSQQLPPRSDKDEELRTKLKHMGKASRKKFTALARRFTSIRRRKSSRQILREQSAPSTANLLDSEPDDGSDVINERTSYDDPPVIEPLPSALKVVPSMR